MPLAAGVEVGSFDGFLDQEHVGIRGQVGMQFQIGEGYVQGWSQEVCV